MTQTMAIVGMACRYPDARSPQELWENVLSQRRAFRSIPPERFSLDDYYDPDRNAPDRTYSSQGAFLTDYAFDREHFRISGKTYRSSDLAHWLALDVAEQAFADAGFTSGRVLPNVSTTVLVGNTLTGEFSRAQVLRLRWPYVSRVVTNSLVQEGWNPENIQRFLIHLEQDYKKPFAPVGEETLAGSLSNTIAGRICNYFNLKGGGYTVDGACSSSLLAIIQACRALESKDADVALAGGVDLSIDPFEIIGFAKTSALASEEMRIYDVQSNGFLPGEGCGFVVLMRYEDALAQQYHIHALIRGWGISSDGSGGITRPEVEGQRLALSRAYNHTGFPIDTIPYFEGHGTGTMVGDTTELQALSFTRNQIASSSPTKAFISSIKANIGHTKAASGIAGLIKASMAISNQIIPPTTGTVDPHPELTRPHASLQTLQKGKIWPTEAPLRAGVSSMGFGGINTHIVLEGPQQERRQALTPHEQTLLSSFQNAELFLFRASTMEDLQQQIARLLPLAPRISSAELTDMAAYLTQNLSSGSIRAAIVVSKPRELVQCLEELQKIIQTGTHTHIDAKTHIYLSHGTSNPRIAFLFPGQGSPAHLSGGILRSIFPAVDTLYQQASLPSHVDEKQTEIAQPAITTASQAGLIVLQKMGLEAQIGLGHSLGELTALKWAGVFDADALLRIARARGNAMAQMGEQGGAMLSVQADAQTVTELLYNTTATISGFNAPHQTVIAGHILTINKIAARAHAMKLRYTRLPVSHAFHSALVAPAADLLATYLQQEHFSAPLRPIVSTVTGDFIKHESIKELLCQQVTTPVHFLEAITRIEKDIDLFIEVGPGKALTNLVSEITSKPVVATDAGSASIKGMLSAIASAFVLGSPISTSELFAHRFIRPIDLHWDPSFLANPCEQVPLPLVERPKSVLPTQDQDNDQSIEQPAATHHTGQPIIDLVRAIIAEHTELPLQIIHSESRMLSDLHLNSITVGQILAEACHVLSIAPSASHTQYADATLSRIAQVLEDSHQQEAQQGDTAKAEEIDGINQWIRSFSVIEQEKSLVTRPHETETGYWHIFAPQDYQLADELSRALASIKGIGCATCLTADLDEAAVKLMLQSTQAMLAQRETSHFVLIQHGSIGAAFVRTLYLEYPHLTVCIIHLPIDLSSAIANIADEVRAAQGFVEASYNSQGKRTEIEVVPYTPPASQAQLKLDRHDVVLVAGGGKGIAAECAFALAQKTGVALALLGRSHPEHDPTLAENLTRLEQANIRYHYIPVDVQEADLVMQAVQEIEARLGSITAIIHGSGSNIPTPLATLDEEAVVKTIAPKVKGLQNILAAISSQNIKYLVTFGSVIARTGMQGEAHYALANEWLASCTEEFQRAYPTASCLCIEWSVWAGVGMGERLGSVNTLRQIGITPIPPEEGIAIFLQLLAQQHPVTRIIVSGRFGTSPTLKMASRTLPFFRFLEKPLIFYPDIELITEIEMSPTTDLYLDDHRVQGERLVPAVIGLEAMAQIAQAVTGNTARPLFTHVQFDHPIVIPEQPAVTLRLMALVHADGSIAVALRSSQTAYQINHFQAICHFNLSDHQSLQIVIPQPTYTDLPNETVTQLRPIDELYGQILFHRGRFRRIERYIYLHATECIADIMSPTDDTWFARYLPSQLVLGDAATRDAIIHSIQACIPHATLLPVGVERIIFIEQPAVSAQRIRVHARERERHGDLFIYDVETRDQNGRLLEQWQGLHLRLVGTTVPQAQWAEALLGPYFERRIAEFYPQLQLQLTLQMTSPQEASQPEILASTTFTAISTEDMEDPISSSAANASNMQNAARTLTFTTPSQDTCTIKTVMQKPRAVWRKLLDAPLYALAEHMAAESLEDFNIIATRILAAIETLEKAEATFDAPLGLAATKDDGWQILEMGPHVLMTYMTHLRNHQQPTVFTFYYQPAVDAQVITRS